MTLFSERMTYVGGWGEVLSHLKKLVGVKFYPNQKVPFYPHVA